MDYLRHAKQRILYRVPGRTTAERVVLGVLEKEDLKTGRRRYRFTDFLALQGSNPYLHNENISGNSSLTRFSWGNATARARLRVSADVAWNWLLTRFERNAIETKQTKSIKTRQGKTNKGQLILLHLLFD